MLLFTLNDQHSFLKNKKKAIAKIKTICKSVCHFLKIKKQLVFDINLTNELEIRNINKKYRHINKVTDVITFAFNDNKEVSTFLLGEIYVCYPFCLKQASQAKTSFDYEFYFVIVHGILHMFGFEHKTKQTLSKMLKITQMILDNCHIK